VDPVPDRARFSPEAVLLGKNCAGRGDRSCVRSTDSRRVQGHVHRERKKRVSRSDRCLTFNNHTGSD